MSQIRRRRQVIFLAIALCVVFLFSVIIVRPAAPSAFIDDWSYADIALRLAQSGTLHYNGWGGSWVLFQTVWGAAWIRLFGFSFDLLRWATVPFSLGFVLLVYALGRKIRLSPALALLAALATGTSPLFLPFAASFMTEPYTCFFTALCLYAAVASQESDSPAQSSRWLWVLTLAGIIGGSNRQTVWAAPLTLIPYLLWKKRQSRRFVAQAVAAWCICLVCLMLLVLRLPQPYAPLAMPPAKLASLLVNRSVIAAALLGDSLLACLLMALPVLLCAVPFWPRIGWARLGYAAVGAALATALLVAIFAPQHGLAPFLGNTLTPFGVLDRGNECLGYKPLLLPLSLRIALTFAFLVALAAFFLVSRNSCTRVRPPAEMLIFFGGSILLLIPGAAIGFTFDRYMLPLLPVVLLALMATIQPCVGRVPVLSWLCVLLFGGYGMATTHDYFASLRARAAAAGTLERLGIARQRISGGLEYDGWTQLQSAGTIRPVFYGEAESNTPGRHWFWKNADAIDPQYVALYADTRDLPPDRLATVPFIVWLPPFERVVVVVKRSSLEVTGRHPLARRMQSGS